MAKDIERWIKLAEWRGKTVQAIVDMDKEITENKAMVKETEKRLDTKILALQKELKEVKTKQNELYVKVASLAGTVGIITTLVVNYFSG